MSEFKKGDRVKVTLEGVVSYTAGDYYVSVFANGHYLGDAYLRRDGVTVEKLPDPLPTTPGSVIRHLSYGFYRMLDEDGVWFGRPLDSARRPRHTGLLEQDYEVVYDAGAQR